MDDDRTLLELLTGNVNDMELLAKAILECGVKNQTHGDPVQLLQLLREQQQAFDKNLEKGEYKEILLLPYLFYLKMF